MIAQAARRPQAPASNHLISLTFMLTSGFDCSDINILDQQRASFSYSSHLNCVSTGASEGALSLLTALPLAPACLMALKRRSREIRLLVGATDTLRSRIPGKVVCRMSR